MAGEFDPYYKWLGIPPRDQPPNHYRLLGIELFEADREVIDAAANRVMAYLKSLATGGEPEHSQRLLNEVAAARQCLLSPAKKAGYDAHLRAQLDAVAQSVREGEMGTGQPASPANCPPEPPPAAAPVPPPPLVTPLVVARPLPPAPPPVASPPLVPPAPSTPEAVSPPSTPPASVLDPTPIPVLDPSRARRVRRPRPAARRQDSRSEPGPKKTEMKRRSRPPPLWLALSIAGGLVLLVVLLIVGSTSEDSGPTRGRRPPSPATRHKPAPRPARTPETRPPPETSWAPPDTSWPPPETSWPTTKQVPPESLLPPDRGLLVLDWPVEQRPRVLVYIDGQLQNVPPSGPVEYALPPGTHQLRMQRLGYELIEEQVMVVEGARWEYEPQWLASPELSP